MNLIFRRALFSVALGLVLHGAAFAGSTITADAAPGATTLENCSWNHPGVNPFMGDVVAAVDRYRDIPEDVRTRLKARMAKREYDDLVSIRREGIEGQHGYQYDGRIREMHFGAHELCHSVTRASWSAAMQERGLVYCDSGQCILVPTVCRNVSRITRAATGSERANALPAAVPPHAIAEGDASPLAMDDSSSFESPLPWYGPTGAGVSAVGGASVGYASGGIPYGGASILASGSGPTQWPSSAPPGSNDGDTPPVVPVPEPQTWALLLLGIVCIGWARRGRRQLPSSP
jgi:hypothetical protein